MANMIQTVRPVSVSTHERLKIRTVNVIGGRICLVAEAVSGEVMVSLNLNESETRTLASSFTEQAGFQDFTIYDKDQLLFQGNVEDFRKKFWKASSFIEIREWSKKNGFQFDFSVPASVAI